MSFRYAVIGAGMQGTAAAFDLARFGDAIEVRLLDADMRRAEAAADRVNRLAGAEIATAGVLDASDEPGIPGALEDIDACLSAVPYFYNVGLARAAIEAGTHFNDLGGNTQVVEAELALDSLARAAG